MDTNGSTCPICLEPLSDKAIGSPDICDHKFCLACLEKWAKHGNFCPVDKQKFKNIISGDEVIPIKFKRKKRGRDLYDVSVHCEICKDNKEGNDTVILCDSCDLAYHLDCLNPPLKSIPAGNWDCPACVEVLRKKKLKSQTTKDGAKAHKTSTNSKRGSSLFHDRLISPTKQIETNNASLKFPKTKYNPVKQSSFPEIDFCQKEYSCMETVNSSDNCTETLPGEFEDFFNISENKIILTQRKLLNSEKKSFNKNFGKEFWTNVNFQVSKHAKNTSYNSSETLQTERKTKRLAAAIASNNIYQSLKNTDNSSEQFSVSENDSLESAALSTLNHFADIKKDVLSQQSCTSAYNNKIATNYKEEFSLCKPKSIDKIGFEGKSTLIENSNKSAASRSKWKTWTTFTNAKSPDFLCASETASWKASSTSTEVNDSQATNLNSARIQDMSVSFKLMNVTNYNDKLPLSKSKSVNGMGLESIEENCTLIENLNKNAPSKSSSSENGKNFTFSILKPTNIVTEDFNRNEFLCPSETTSCKAFPTSTEINNSAAENLNCPQSYLLKSFNHKNITNYTDKFSLSKSKSVNEMGLESIKGKSTLVKSLNENEASKSSSSDYCKNSATFTNAKSPNLSAGRTVSPLKIKMNGSCAVLLKKHEILEMPKSLSVSKEPDVVSTICKPVHAKEILPNKGTRKESCETNSSEDFRILRRKLNLTEARTKRLAATNARKKLIENFKSSSEESSGDESSDSLDQHNIPKSDDVANSPLKSSNHYLFENIEKALSRRNSPHLIKNDEDSTSELILESKSSEGIKEKNAVMEVLSRRETSPIPKISPCITEDFNRIQCLSSARAKIKNSVVEELRNDQIHSESETSSVFKKPEIVDPPELSLEPLKTPLKLGNEIPPDLLIEPLKIMRKHGNEMLPIAKEEETEHTYSLVGDWKNDTFSSASSVFEKVPNISDSAEKQSSKNRTTNGITYSHVEGCQNANNLQDDVFSQENDNSSEIEIVGEENILDTFRIRQVHYAIKAKMNLPSELQKIEQETWLSSRSKSSRRYKYKSSRNEAKIRTSSSHHQVVFRNEQLHNFFQSSHLDCNKSSNIKKDVEECNKFNPFCESVTSTRPKKHFKVTEYKLEPSDKQFRFNKIPKNVLRSFMGPYSVEHLDMHEDGSLFLNWAKSKSR